MNQARCPGCSRMIPYADHEWHEIFICARCEHRFRPSGKEVPPLPAPAVVSAPTVYQSVTANPTVNVHFHRSFPHTLHLILTILTCGLWAPIWIIHYLLSQ